jgi:hypothetical protein
VITEDQQTKEEEFHIPIPARPLRAVDLLPGTAAIVRRAAISVRTAADARAAGITPERLIALWVPGDHPVALDAGVAFQVPTGAELVVRIHYQKTWQYERRAMTDESRVGLYFAEAGAAEVQVLRGTAVNQDVRALGLYVDPNLSGVDVTVSAERPDGSREELIAFRQRAEWPRRYWFREPVLLPRGTRLRVTADPEGKLAPPAAAPTPPPVAPASLLLSIDVLAGQ